MKMTATGASGLTFGTLARATGLSAITLRAAALSAAAAKEPGFNFVLFRVIGGMDSTLGIHPWEDTRQSFDPKDLWLNYQVHRDVMQAAGGTKISLGPSAHALAPYAKYMNVVRGIYLGVSDVGHPAAIGHISSGYAQESAPHFASFIAERCTQLGTSVVSNSAIQTAANQSFPVTLTDEFRNMTDPDRFESESGLGLYQDKNLGVSRFNALQDRRMERRKFADVISKQPKEMNGTVKDETYALAALASGLTNVVQIDIDDQLTNLDTHSGQANHGAFQKMRWDRIAEFLKGLVEYDLMKTTLVVVVTEFNRSPGANANSGKDHNYTDNAIALFGRGVNGGQTVGDRSLYIRSDKNKYSHWAGHYIDYRTGATTQLDSTSVLPNGDVRPPAHVDLIRPADLWATIATSLGSGIEKASPTDGKYIPLVFR